MLCETQVKLPIVPLAIFFAWAGSGWVEPRPFTEWNPLGSFSIYSACFNSCLNKCFYQLFFYRFVIHFSQSDFSQHCETTRLVRRRKAIVGRLGDHVGEVQTLAKHVPKQKVDPRVGRERFPVPFLIRYDFQKSLCQISFTNPVTGASGGAMRRPWDKIPA